MAEFLASPLKDSNGQNHGFTYKKGNKLFPADLAYNNEKTSFKIYFVYNMNNGAGKEKECVFEMVEDGVTTVFELPKAEEDVQAIVRSMFMY